MLNTEGRNFENSGPVRKHMPNCKPYIEEKKDNKTIIYKNIEQYKTIVQNQTKSDSESLSMQRAKYEIATSCSPYRESDVALIEYISPNPP